MFASTSALSVSFVSLSLNIFPVQLTGLSFTTETIVLQIHTAAEG